MTDHPNDGIVSGIQAPINSKVSADADFAIGYDHAGSGCAWQPIGEIAARLVANALRKSGERSE